MSSKSLLITKYCFRITTSNENYKYKANILNENIVKFYNLDTQLTIKIIQYFLPLILNGMYLNVEIASRVKTEMNIGFGYGLKVLFKATQIFTSRLKRRQNSGDIKHRISNYASVSL